MKTSELNITTTPYVLNLDQYGNDTQYAQRMELAELDKLLQGVEEKDINYYTDDDAVDGGAIYNACIAFGKKLPEDNDWDMRDYCSFFFTDENTETEYGVFMLDEWPVAEDKEEEEGYTDDTEGCFY